MNVARTPPLLLAALLAACAPINGAPFGAVGTHGLTCTQDDKRDCTSSGTVRWSVNLSAQGGGSAVSGVGMSATRAFFLWNGTLNAFDRRSGALLWRTALRPSGPNFVAGYGGPSSALFADDNVLAVDISYEIGHDVAQSWLWLIDAHSGKQLHRVVSQPTESFLVFAVTSGVVLLDHGSTVEGIDARTGSSRWQTEVRASGPYAFGTVLYQGCGSCSVIKRTDVRTGHPLSDLPRPTLGNLILIIRPVSAGLLLVPTQSRLIAIDAATGSERWGMAWPSKAAGSAFSVDRLAGPPVVYLYKDQHLVVAVDALTGKVLSDRAAAWWTVGNPVAHGRAVSLPEDLEGVDVQTAAVRWRLPRPPGSLTTWTDDEPPLAIANYCDKTPTAAPAGSCSTYWAVAINP